MRNHKRKYNKTDASWQAEPSKTKWRDLADVVRHACVDYNNDDFIDYNPDGKDLKSFSTPDGSMKDWRAAGYHSSQGSVVLGPDGKMLPMEMLGPGDSGNDDDEIFLDMGY